MNSVIECCNCHSRGDFETPAEAVEVGWTRLKLEGGFADEYWFCPREASPLIRRTLESLESGGRRVVREGPIREN